MIKLISCILLFLLAATTLLAQADTLEGLVAYYPFSGNANDESGNQNHGVVEGPVLTTDRFGVADAAYEFNGVDDIIRILDDSTLRLTDDFTLVAWVMPYTIKDHTVFRKNSSQNAFPAQLAYGLGLSSTPHFTFSIGTDLQSNGLSSQLGLLTFPYEVNNWYRMIAQKENQTITLTLNIDGKNTFRFYRREIEGMVQYDTSPMLIGSRTRQASNTFEGKIDDIMVFNRFVSLGDITGLNFEDEITSVVELDEDLVSYRPNPFSDHLVIETTGRLSEEDLSVSIYNSLGVHVRSNTSQGTIINIETSDLTPGIYFLKMSSGSARSVRTIIKVDE